MMMNDLLPDLTLAIDVGANEQADIVMLLEEVLSRVQRGIDRGNAKYSCGHYVFTLVDIGTRRRAQSQEPQKASKR